MASLALISTIASAAGTGISMLGAYREGQAAKISADFEAQQLDAKADEETAAAQRDALAKRREGALINSRAQALAAASGAGAGDDAPTIVKLMSQTAREADYNARSSMYGGLSRASGLRDQAKGRRASGKAALQGSVFAALGTGLKGINSFASSKGWG